MTEYDDDNHPIPTVDFPFAEVGRALGDLDAETETLARAVSGADVAARFHDLLTDGLERTRRPYRNAIFRIRFEVLLYFLGRHPDQDLPLCLLADKHGFRRHTVTDEAARLRGKLGLPERLLSNSGVKIQG